jgi:limonene-1,2-epoxide hydrolase
MTKTEQSIVTEQSVVEAFLERLEALELDEALDLISEDCVYKNMPFHKANGKERIERDLRAMLARVNSFEVEMINIASEGGVVLTERIDTIGTGSVAADIELMGVFVVKDGLITEWRDYFDWTSTGGRFVKSAFSRLLGNRF